MAFFTGITVLSPHRDDAVFSLGLSMEAWSGNGIRCRVMNFFTESRYAPRLPACREAQISHRRQVEDRRALRSVSPVLATVDCGLKDAPIRLSLGFEQLMTPESAAYLSNAEVEGVAHLIASSCRSELVIAPLALGFHVDHQLVSLAGLQAVATKRLGFYEDLPYATWTSEDDIQRRIRAISKQLGARYSARYNRSPMAARKKQQFSRYYDSQMSPEEIARIAHYTAKYKGAERVWLPMGSPGWNFIR